MRAENFRWATIALFLPNNPSVRTLRRWRQDVDFKRTHEPLRPITDDELQEVIADFMQDQEEGRGFESARGHLAALQYRVSRQRIRNAVRAFSPQAVQFRRQRRRPRIQYNVVGYNYLWHNDGWHKLITWGIVVHGCVDGATRLCTYLGARNNNRQETVFELFEEAIEELGCPWRMRGDEGGENNLVARYMNAQGEQRGLYNLEGYIRGPSVHNTRIEGFWSHMRQRCTQFWINFFSQMGDTSTPVNLRLDSTQDSHKFVLQHVFLPLINENLQIFKNFWNSHSLSTEGNFSPVQLRRMSWLSSCPPPPTHVELENYGIQPNAHRSEGRTPGTVVIPPNCELATPVGYQTFCQNFPHLTSTHDRRDYFGYWRRALEYYQQLQASGW